VDEVGSRVVPAEGADRPVSERTRSRGGLYEDLDRARLKQLVRLDPQRCGLIGSRWTTDSLGRFLRQHGYPKLRAQELRQSLLLSGFLWSDKARHGNSDRC
jgi:hypothetical protein